MKEISQIILTADFHAAAYMDPFQQAGRLHFPGWEQSLNRD